jgi:hypothetical protein
MEMTNTEALARIEKCNRTRIEKLFWIACSYGSDELEDLLKELSVIEVRECFPDLMDDDSDDFFTEDEDGDLDENGEIDADFLFDNDKLGFFAQVYIPKCHNFSFKDGKPASWRISTGHCIIAYCYGDTLNELVEAIERRAKAEFDDYVKEHLSKHGANEQNENK